MNASQIAGDMNRSQLRSSMTGSTLRSSIVEQPVEVDDKTKFVLEKMNQENITFVEESSFKKDSQCFVCNSVFGSVYSRQHHCRLCSQSVCDSCSMKRVNEKRVCDLCFYKLKNLKGERRKKDFLKTMKKEIQQLAQSLIKGKKELDELEGKLQARKQETSDRMGNIDIYTKEAESNISTLEQKKTEQQKQVEIVQNEHKNLQQDFKQLKQDKNEIESKLKVQITELNNNQAKYDGKSETYKVLKEQKHKIEQSDDFKKLPNYQKALQYESIPLSEAIISLDQQYPPEEYYETKFENLNINNNNPNIIHSGNIYDNQYQQELEHYGGDTNMRMTQKSEIKSYSTRKKGGLCS